MLRGAVRRSCGLEVARGAEGQKAAESPRVIRRGLRAPSGAGADSRAALAAGAKGGFISRSFGPVLVA